MKSYGCFQHPGQTVEVCELHLGCPVITILLFAASTASFLGSFCSLILDFLTFYIPVFSKFLAYPLHFQLHSHSFVHCLLKGTPPALQSILLKSGWKPPWPPDFCIMHSYKAITIWIMLRSAARLNNSQVMLDHGYKTSECLDAWVLWTELQVVLEQDALWFSPHKKSFSFVPFNLGRVGSCWFLGWPQLTLPIVWMQSAVQYSTQNFAISTL